MRPYQIGIDLGGTKTESVLFDPDQQVLHRKRIPTPKKEHGRYATILETVAAAIHETAGHIPQGMPYTVGVGIPGIIDGATRQVLNANTTCLIGRPFKDDLENRIDHAVGMENDANCFTLAESRSGAARDYGVVMGIIMGTGCGGGICVNGLIHDGRHGIAGEWGHYAVDPGGRECYCGNHGCVETKISGSGVEASYFEWFNRRRSMESIVQGFRNARPDSTKIFNQFIEDFGRCLGGLLSLLDPDAVVLGGGLSNIDELYTLGVERVRAYAFHPRIETPILKNQHGDSAGVFGAAWIGL